MVAVLLPGFPRGGSPLVTADVSNKNRAKPGGCSGAVPTTSPYSPACATGMPLGWGQPQQQQGLQRGQEQKGSAPFSAPFSALFWGPEGLGPLICRCGVAEHRGRIVGKCPHVGFMKRGIKGAKCTTLCCTTGCEMLPGWSNFLIQPHRQRAMTTKLRCFYKIFPPSQPPNFLGYVLRGFC